jgi:hypothetical protein
MADSYSKTHQRRYRLTLEFMKHSVQPPGVILDIGSHNPFSEILQNEGFTVTNTGVDLDREPDALGKYEADIVTAFEILEHLLNPLSVLENLPGDRLFASVPLDLWFASAYRHSEDPWDRHFHEFEDWQFDWLLDHAGWEIIRREKWTNPAGKIGIRPLLRLITPRWYIVEAVRKSPD